MAKTNPIDFNDFDMDTQIFIRNVAMTLGVKEYKEIFSNFSKDFVLPKFVCYYALRERGMSLKQIGRTFNREHSTIMSALKQAEEFPEIILYSEEINRTDKERGCLSERIRQLLNINYSNKDIANFFNWSEEAASKVVELVKKKSKEKKIPDYKKYVTRTIYMRA